MNIFPNYIAAVKDDDGCEYHIHFVALFSKKHDAIPLMCIHGWPGESVVYCGKGINEAFKQHSY